MREISRGVLLDRKTVRRIVRGYESALLQDPETGVEDYLSAVPRYQGRARPARVLTEEVTKEIDYWLKENGRRMGSGMRKQCLKKKDIYRELASKGMKISYSTVCRYIRGGRKKASLPVPRMSICAFVTNPARSASSTGGKSSCSLRGNRRA